MKALLEEWAESHPVVQMDEARPPLARWETWLGHPPRGVSPPIRLILVWENLAGHCSYEITKWLFAHGIMSLYTPIGGSWLNMAESLQRISVRRALSGQHPQTPEQMVGADRERLESATHALCLEWQAPQTTGTGSSAALRWVWGSSLFAS